MIKTLYCRLVYTVHMLAPLSITRLLVARLDEGTAERLRQLFP
jgi:hypothetical protein